MTNIQESHAKINPLINSLQSSLFDLVEITITKKDGSSIKLGDEYKEEYFHGRSAFAKYLTDNNHNSS